MKMRVKQYLSGNGVVYKYWILVVGQYLNGRRHVDHLIRRHGNEA
jgi:hypothetical protein